jgi:two-component system cell cycle sensor histidine kinase/response regulator CckA
VGKKAIVLIVDDEARTRQLERHILESGGYKVLEASGAREAFGILDDASRVDLLISDLDMPELTGEVMVTTVRARWPRLKVLYVSGVVDRLLDARKVLSETEAFLDKPFTSKGLLEAVSLLLYDTLTPPSN